MEVYRNGCWGTVCNNNNHTIIAANVCSKLGFPAKGDFQSALEFETGLLINHQESFCHYKYTNYYIKLRDKF